MQPKKRFVSAVPALLVAAAELLATTGCQSSHFAARELPPELLAPPGAGTQRMRLGSMSLVGTRSGEIGPADLLELSIVTGLADDEGEPLAARVREDGAVEVPHVGPVHVAGLEPAAAADLVARAAVDRGVYLRPQVQVKVVEQATNRVTVLGAVAEPGVQEVPRTGCDILAAVGAAGGFTDEAGTVVEVLRHGGSPTPLAAAQTPDGGVRQASFVAGSPGAGHGAPHAEEIDLAQPGSIPASRQRLADRDVVVVRPKEKRVVHVSGLVKTPDQFELTEDYDLRLLDAVAMAGGVSNTVADKVLLIRHVAGRPEPVVVRASLARAKRDGAENLVLQSGDLISVEQTPATAAVDTFNTLFRITMGIGGDLTLF